MFRTLLFLFVALCAQAQTTIPIVGGISPASKTVATLPTASTVSGAIYVVTDAATAGSCTSGGGTAKSWCRSNGTIYEPLGDGGAGGGATSSSTLTDFGVTRTSATVLTIAAGRVGAPNKAAVTTSAATVTKVTSSSGIAFIYATNDGVIHVGKSGTLDVTCSGCTEEGSMTDFPAGVARIAQWAGDDNATDWDVAAGTEDKRAFFLVPEPCNSTAHIAGAVNSSNGGCEYSPATTLALVSSVQGNLNYCPDSGSTDAYVCSLPVALTAYTTGMKLTLKPGTVNTGAATVNVNGLGAKNIKKVNGTTDPDNGDLADETPIDITYDGTSFRLPAAGGGGAAAPWSDIKTTQTAVSIPNGSYGDIYSVTVPAGVPAAGKCVQVEVAANKVAGTNAVTARLAFGATNFQIILSSTSNIVRHHGVRICNNPGVTNAQEILAFYFHNGAAYGDLTSTSINSGTNPGTASIDTTAAWDLKLQVNGTAGGDTMQVKQWVAREIQ